MNRFSKILVWLFFLFLLYKYVLLQLGLVKPGSALQWVIILLLVVVSFVIGGFETAVTTVDDSEISAWLDRIGVRWSQIDEALAGEQFNGIRIVVHPVARALHYVTEVLAVAAFSETRRSIILGQVHEIRIFNVEKCIALMLTVSVIIDVNITVLFSSALRNSDVFVKNRLEMPYISGGNLFDSLLPLPGSAGFTSVGVSLLMLVLIETLPKRIGYRNPSGFLRRFGWIVGLIYLLYLPRIISSNMEDAADFITSSCERLRLALRTSFDACRHKLI
jgi:CBS domain containing-hemolysin-like protein